MSSNEVDSQQRVTSQKIEERFSRRNNNAIEKKSSQRICEESV
jgi:hypothetical protein